MKDRNDELKQIPRVRSVMRKLSFFFLLISVRIIKKGNERYWEDETWIGRLRYRRDYSGSWAFHTVSLQQHPLQILSCICSLQEYSTATLHSVWKYLYLLYKKVFGIFYTNTAGVVIVAVD